MNRLPLVWQILDTCCHDEDQINLIKSLLGNQTHASDLDVTRHMGQVLKLDEFDKVLDITSGDGGGDVMLSQTYGCQVVGLTNSEDQLSIARRTAFKSKSFEKVTFKLGNISDLPFLNDSYDIVLCESALSSFPDKDKVIDEIRRVLRPGGRTGIIDVTLERELPLELAHVAAMVPSFNLTFPSDGYRDIFEDHEFGNVEIEDLTGVLADTIRTLQIKVMMARLAASNDVFQMDSSAFEATHDLISLISQSVTEGDLSFIMLTAVN